MQKTSVSRQAAIEGLRVVTWTARADTWTVLSIGRGIERLLGYPRTAWRTKGFWLSKVHPADTPGLRECLAQSRTGPRQAAVTCEYRITDAAGELRWLRTSIVSGGPGARTIAGAHLDITDEFRALEALGIASERSQFALRVAGVSIWERDLDENDGISPTIAALAGVKPGRHLGLDEWLEIVHPRDRERFAAHARKVSRPTPAPRGALAPLMALV
ncbi:MAG TPA: PAS domain-containing protein, partial [Gemmatimonadaceae bacterium]